MDAGFIGIGNMGLPMAGRLLDGGVRLGIHDARREALEPLLARQARAFDSPKAMADACPVVFASLPTLDTLRQVVLGDNGVIEGSACKTLVNTCTVGRKLVGELDAALAERGITLIDCPISGGPPGAEAGTLSVMVSGERTAIERLRPMLERWGPLTIAGDKPGLAQALKLSNNILSFVAMAASCEAFVMGAKAGVDPEIMVEAINRGSGRNSATIDKIPRAVLGRTFDYGAPLYIINKDADLAIELAEELGVPMWVCLAARAMFRHAAYEGLENDDMTALIKLVERGARFELPKTR